MAGGRQDLIFGRAIHLSRVTWATSTWSTELRPKLIWPWFSSGDGFADTFGVWPFGGLPSVQ